MYLIWEDGSARLADRADFSTLKLVIEGDPSRIDDVRESLADLAVIPSTECAWITIDGLRGLGQVTDPAWANAFDCMIEKAARAGWVDRRSGMVRAHIEWQQSDTAQLEHRFRKVMRHLAATVSIITARQQGEPFGMLATAVTSLTMDPPAILICVNRSASIANPIKQTGQFCVNFLSSRHEGLLNVFSGAKKGGERFEHGHWNLTAGSLPSLRDALGTLICEVAGSMDYGTHTIFIGRVLHAADDGDAAALIYQRGLTGKFETNPKERNDGAGAVAARQNR